jgi:serine/threonine-protein kinase RsbW
MAGPAHKKMMFPGNPSEASKAQQAIMAEVAAAGYEENACFAVRLALDEALSNAIMHGNRGDESKSVAVEYSVTRDEVRISVADEGPGFHPETVPDPTLQENLEKPHGRGIMLMKAYMSEVHYNARGNAVTMVKLRGCPLPT